MSVQSLSHVRLFATSWTAACQASLTFTNSWSLLKPMSIESVMPSNHLILCRPLLLLPSIFPSIRVFSNESVLHMRWPNYWSFSISISLSSEYSGLISFRIDSFDLLAVQGTLKSSLLHSVFWMLSFKPAFSLSSFTFIKRLLFLLHFSAIRVVSSAYLRLLRFLPAILTPACTSSTQHFTWCTLHIS